MGATMNDNNIGYIVILYMPINYCYHYYYCYYDYYDYYYLNTIANNIYFMYYGIVCISKTNLSNV